MTILHEELKVVWGDMLVEFQDICIAAKIAHEYRSLPTQQYNDIIEAVIMAHHERSEK